MSSWFGLLILFGAVIGVGLIALLVREPFLRRAPKPLTDEHIREAVRDGKAVTAIRWHRELHGSSLAVAKEAIEQLKNSGTST